MSLRYFTSLDGLRAIAAIAVIVSHFFTLNRIPDHSFVVAIASVGSTGVSLFFVLSGFVITRILINTAESKNYFKNFYVRRTLRIFPLYYIALLCYYTIPYLLSIKDSIPPLSQTIYYYTYMQNIARTFIWNDGFGPGPGHFWSLAVEEHFYLFWPFIIFFFCKRELHTIGYIIIFIILGTLVLRYIMLTMGYSIEVFTLTRLDQLAMGAGLVLLERKNWITRKYRKWFVASIIVGAAGVICCSLFTHFYQDLLKHTFFGFFFSGFIAICVIYNDKGWWFTSLMKVPLMQYLGRISYGIYVWHGMGLILVDRFFSSGYVLIDFILVVGITIVISAISFTVLEKPFLKLKKFFPSNGPEKKDTPQPSIP